MLVLRMLKDSLFQSQFKKNLFVLLSGMAIAQAVPILFSPVLTRFFSPDDFGDFATFLAVSSFFTVVMSGKYELAIILPKRNEEAINLLSLSVLLSLVVTVVSSISLFFFAKSFTRLLDITEIESIVWLVPFFSFFATIYLLFNEWSIRKNNFLILSQNKITNTSSISVFSLFFGVNKIAFGLIFGQIFGQITAALLSTYRVMKEDKGLFKFVGMRKMRFFAARYVNFAKFNIPGQLINTLAGQLPIFFIGSCFGTASVGYYALTDRVLGVPLSFLGNSFKDVFKQKAATDYKEQGNCLSIYKKTTFTLIGLSIIPFVVLFIYAPVLFSKVFGEQWLASGEFARPLCLMYMFSFVSMPTSWVFVVAEKQKLDLLWQVMFLLFTVISLGIGYLLNNIHLALWSFCVGRSLIYLIQIAMTYHFSKGVQRA
jgi:O-antigen/teichoic acid export membrane protein